jgi:poly(hydroxyalkanoate) depolymerase family esterase
MKMPPIRSWLRPRLRAAAPRADIAATIDEALRVLPGAPNAPRNNVVSAGIARTLDNALRGLPVAKHRMPAAPAGVARPTSARKAPANDAVAAPGFSSGRQGPRVYKLFVPDGDASVARPLLVMLHGCTQDPDDFALGTRMNELATQRGVLVLYPAQPSSSNPARCWNWFRPEDQRRGGGEPEAIVDLVRHVSLAHRVDADRVYVAGLSAGGAMAAILAQQYPDVFAAAGVHSGLAPGAASDATSAFAAMRQGTRDAPLAGDGRVPVMVLHGDRDTTVHPANAGRVLAALLPRDAAEEHDTAPAARRSVFRKDGRVVGESWTLRGTGHAWSGGHASGSYTAPGGVDASAEMLRFFLQHPRRR